MAIAQSIAQQRLDIIHNAGVSASSTASTSTGVDISETIGNLLLTYQARTGGTGTVTVAIEHSSDLSSNYSAVPAAALLDALTGEPTTLSTFSTTGAEVTVGLRRDLIKKYIRISFSGTTLTQNYAVALLSQVKYT